MDNRTVWTIAAAVLAVASAAVFLGAEDGPFGGGRHPPTGLAPIPG